MAGLEPRFKWELQTLRWRPQNLLPTPTLNKTNNYLSLALTHTHKSALINAESNIYIFIICPNLSHFSDQMDLVPTQTPAAKIWLWTQFKTWEPW